MPQKPKKPQKPKFQPNPKEVAPSQSKSSPTAVVQPLTIPKIRPFDNTWQPYDLDHYAQDLAIQCRDRDVLNESHKMRMTVAYGLERFWGEPFRLEQQKEYQKAAYWRAVWQTVAAILNAAGIILPDGAISGKDREEQSQIIQQVADEIWQGTKVEQKQKAPEEILGDREVALMVLSQFCDCLVWWAQRYKVRSGD